MDSTQILFGLLFVVLTFFYVLRSNSRRRKSAKLPPGPYPLPIIGNFLQLGQKPHKSLAKLAQTYGPLMYLKLGRIDTIVVTSPEIAKEVLQIHGQTLSNRRIPAAAEVYDHEKHSMAWVPMATQWRILRKIWKEQMFSVQRLDERQDLRQEKLQKLCDYLHECSNNGQLVDICEAVFITLLNIMSATLFSVNYVQFNSSSVYELKEAVQGMIKIVAVPNIADYFPIFKSIDPQGIRRRAKSHFGKIYAILEDVIKERLESRNASSEYVAKNDLLDTLLDCSKSNAYELSTDDIKHILLDLFAGGTDTTASTLEWVLTELVCNPKKMSTLRNELWTVVGRNQQIQESDISRLPYLQSVIKETFRFHPIGPLLIPHKAEADTEINGYLIPKNAQILVNVWAIGRDPSIWPNPNSFEPERFLERPMDFRGQDLELIPFGSGRRMCPGMPLAYRMLHLIVASLVQNFDWKLEQGMKPEDMDLDEKFGTTLHKAVPLKLHPIKL